MTTSWDKLTREIEVVVTIDILFIVKNSYTYALKERVVGLVV